MQGVTVATVSAGAEETQSDILPQHAHTHSFAHENTLQVRVYVHVSVRCDPFPLNQFPDKANVLKMLDFVLLVPVYNNVMVTASVTIRCISIC